MHVIKVLETRNGVGDKKNFEVKMANFANFIQLKSINTKKIISMRIIIKLLEICNKKGNLKRSKR